VRIVFDLDGTLCYGGPPYENCIPKCEAADALQALKEQGHTIVIHTARGMGRSAGNPGQATATIGALTVAQLRDWGFVYDELLFGKPAGDWYVDDKSVTTLAGLLKTLEFHE